MPSNKYYDGRINMPGQMMTKAGKRMQMLKDFNRESPRKGKPRRRKKIDVDRDRKGAYAPDSRMEWGR